MTLCLLLFGVTTSWADTKTINVPIKGFCSSGSNTYANVNTEATHGGVDFVAYAFNDNNGQIRGNKTIIHGNSTGTNSSANFHLFNTTPMPGSISKIVLKASSGTLQNKLYVALGKESQGGVTSIANLASATVDNSAFTFEIDAAAGYTYFKICSTEKFTNGNVFAADSDAVCITYETAVSKDPFINASNVELAADATSGTISYSISNPVEGKSISASTTADWISNFEYTDNTVTFTTKANTTTAARTANITLTYEGATDKVVTITQKGKPFDTIGSMYDAASSTATSSTIKFGNWVVSGVASSNAYVTDGTNGFIIYAKDHGFEVGDILSGTVTCSLQLYNGSAELTGITSTTEGLTVTTGGTVTPKETTIDKLSGLNTGAVIVLKGVNYDGTNFTDGTNSIQPYKTFMTLPAFDKSKKYNVTGVYIQFGTTKEIAPRSEADIEEVVAAKYSITVAEGIEHGTVTPNVTSAIEGTKVTLTIEPETHYELSTLTITDSNGANVKYNEVDYSFLMPAYNVTVSATFAESAKYYVIYTSLGEEVGDGEEVYAGECIAKAPEVTAPEGWEFAGWTADETFTTSTAVPTYFTDETPVTQDTILYAVFSKTITAGSSTGMAIATLCNDSIVKYIAGSYNTGSIKVGNDVWEYNACTQTYSKTGVKYMQIRKNAATSYVKLPDFNSNIVSIMLKDVNNGSNAQYTGDIYFRTECDNDADAIVVAKTTEAGEDVVLNIPNGYKTGYIMSSAACRFTDIVVTLSNVTRIYSTTTVFDDYTRDGLTEGNLGTICLASDALVEGAQAYEVSSMTMNGDNISSITFSPVEKVEGGKGYLFVASGSELTAEYISEAKTEDENNNGLVGSLEGTNVAEGKYIINNNKVKKCGTGCKIAANRAYIDPTKYVGELSAKGETITIELETPTSINELMQKVTAPGQWYNLNGQPVAQPTKGVFTKNGVKYIFK